MKLSKNRLNKPKKSESRHRGGANLERMPKASTYAYTSRRSDEELNLNRKLDRLPKDQVVSAGRFWSRRFGLFILALVVIISLFNVLSLSSSPKIMLLDPSSKLKLSAQDVSNYQNAVTKVLNSSVWNKNKLTVDTEAISNKLVDEFPDLNSVSIAIPLVARRPVVYVEPSQPAVILSESNAAYEINTNGRAVSKAASSQAFSNLGLPVINDQTGINVKLHAQVLSSTYVNFIQEVTGQLAAKGFQVSGMSLPAQAFELDVSLAGQPYFVKFNLQNDDPRQQAGTFLATINYLKSKNVTPGKYVDVRLDGRAYYM
jgi:hypothetical protein